MADERQPYAPPQSPLEDVDAPSGSPWLGVIAGTVVDIGGTVVAGIVLSIAYSMQLTAQGVAVEQLHAHLMKLPASSWPFIAGIGIGLCCSLLGGYVCAALAKRHVYRWGGVLALVVCALGFLLGAPQYAPLINLLMALATCGAVTAGVWLFARRASIDGP